ncbi:FHA domain-containing protein [Parabacteroides sp.]|uniref:FHA domain-containing protein n=1 Tax=Parabacteroides sp. TaxID=1869337 RepID=UPI00257C4C9B|nr:FHA domain-containing protein [Parabacteroides sp.]
MKLIKIGRSVTCDIVLPSENVSSLHAEILILDNGEIFLEDKNSTNGTKVGNKKIVPNTETPIRRGDYVVFADMELPWARVPQAESLNNYKQVLNIGTNFKNDIVIEGTYCSRYHASFRLSKNGKKAFIRDLNSKNGVKVNGVKIHPNKDVEIKKNDVVICGDTDISEDLRPHIPDPYRWMKKTGVGMGAVAMIAVIAFAIWRIIDKPDGPKPISPTEMRPATVYVDTKFYYIAILEDNPISSVWSGIVPLNVKELEPYSHYSGTAFFIDSLGRMGTNRHVAIPWEYREKAVDNYIKNHIEKLIDEQFKLRPIRSQAQYEYFVKKTPLGEAINDMTKTISEMNAIISRIRKSPYKISGVVEHRLVGYPGRNYTSYQEMEHCDLLLESGTRDKDIAILQLNTKKTPAGIAPIFHVNDFRLEPLEPMKETLYTIGYPHGLNWGLDDKTQSLEPFIRSVNCSKVPSTFDFEFQGESVGGASGSPIFDEYGRLAGVLWGGWRDGVTYGKACQAKWLKQLYKKAIGEIE